MVTYTQSVCSLDFRCDSGSILPSAPSFSSGLYLDVDGAYAKVSDEDVIRAALRILSARIVRGDRLTDPRNTREYFAMRFAGLEHEIFVCLYLNNRNRVIACEELFRGTIDGAAIHPREVVKRVLVHNAASVIFAHNHPSGVAEPSYTDGLITTRLKQALALIDVPVIDHLVVGGATVESMSERGFM